MDPIVGGSKLSPGRYIIAVSGGVDSITLLDILSKYPGIELIVAHFNHGMRPDSTKDEKLVAKTAQDHKLKFEVGYGRLGAEASEERARMARYAFLEDVKKSYKARSIITAHQQDDLIETAIINVIRGTGRRGLSAIRDNPLVQRPLINTPKKAIVAYAKQNKLRWIEDSTNTNPRYLRNYIRVQIIPKLSQQQRAQLLNNIDKVAKHKPELDNLIATLSHSVYKSDLIDRSKFTTLPLEVAKELVSFWLRANKVSDFDRKTIDRLSLGLRTARANTELIADKNLKLIISAEHAHFSNR